MKPRRPTIKDSTQYIRGLAYCLDENFYRSFDAANASHQQLLDCLIRLEEHFIQSGEVPIEHAIILAASDR